jgi:hypothetical protein
VVSGDRVFFDREEYIINSEGDLSLVQSNKGIEQKLAKILTNLGIK